MLRRLFAALVLGTLLLAPLGFAVWHGIGWGGFAGFVIEALARAIEDVGIVVVPQLALAVAVVGLALEQVVHRIAGVAPRDPPDWLDPAVESALLLGMLGTISGMVNGFVGLSPERLEPGPLVYALGTALRSSFVGFGIALIGVWTRLPTRSAVVQESAS